MLNIMNNIIRKQIELSQLKIGMTVEKDGELLTVGKDDIKYSSFMGYSFRGASYPRTIIQVIFKVPIKDGFRYE